MRPVAVLHIPPTASIDAGKVIDVVVACVFAQTPYWLYLLGYYPVLAMQRLD